MTHFSTTDCTAEVQEPTDEILMASIQQGDASALKAFYQRHRRVMKSMVLRAIHDDALAEDVVQDCLLNLWNQARSYSPDKGKPLAWVVTLCRRRSIDAVRRQMTYCRAKERMEESLSKLVNEGPSGGEYESNDMMNVLEQHLSLLPEHQREVIRLSFLDGLSQREVSRKLQTPLGTVKTRLELGLKKLRTTLRTRSSIDTLRAA